LIINTRFYANFSIPVSIKALALLLTFIRPSGLSNPSFSAWHFNCFCKYFLFYLTLQIVVMFLCFTVVSSVISLICSKQLILLYLESEKNIFVFWNLFIVFKVFCSIFQKQNVHLAKFAHLYQQARSFCTKQCYWN
jgi:hypothetical protein